MENELKVCCVNCHYYLSDYENCQGEDDIENDCCHEYTVNLIKKNLIKKV